MDNHSSSNNGCEQGGHCLLVPDAVSHRALICALAADDRLDIPREQEYLFPLLQDLLDCHWMLEPPSDEERASVLELLASKH